MELLVISFYSDVLRWLDLWMTVIFFFFFLNGLRWLVLWMTDMILFTCTFEMEFWTTVIVLYVHVLRWFELWMTDLILSTCIIEIIGVMSYLVGVLSPVNHWAIYQCCLCCEWLILSTNITQLRWLEMCMALIWFCLHV